jgi:Sigma-70 region 2
MTMRAEDFERHRPLLFSIAYWMLGSVAEAEDIVQEAYLRWRDVPEEEVRSPRFCREAVPLATDPTAILSLSISRRPLHRMTLRRSRW